MIYLILILALIGFLIYQSIIGISQLISMYYGVPFIKTPKKIQNEIVKLIRLKPNAIFYDLGCGTGEILRFIAKNTQVEPHGLTCFAEPRQTSAAPSASGFRGETPYRHEQSRGTGTGVKIVGVEASPLFYLFAKLLSKTYPNIKVVFGNFMKINLSDANIIYCYLYPKMMSRMKIKFLHELKHGSQVVSYQFPLPGIRPIKIKQIDKQKLYLYKL